MVEAHAERIAGAYKRAIFYLFNPFLERILADFERAIRGSNARIVYCHFLDLTPFDNSAWKIEIVRAKEYRVAFIAPA